LPLLSLRLEAYPKCNWREERNRRHSLTAKGTPGGDVRIPWDRVKASLGRWVTISTPPHSPLSYQILELVSVLFGFWWYWGLNQVIELE
jgi:hypothetical protein